MRQLSKRRRHGFTLLELVIVLIIIATIAGLVIPQLGFLGRTADMAASAKGQQDVANQLGLFFALQKRMPQRLDSLLEVDGVGAVTTNMQPRTATGSTSGVTALNQAWGFPIAGSNGTHMTPNLFMATLSSTADGHRSFTRLGFEVLVDHFPGAAGSVNNANDSGGAFAPAHERALGTSIQVATVLDGSALAQRIYPGRNGIFPDDVACVVAVGVGPRCALVPNTMLNAPSYPGSDGNYYGRYIAYFACFRNGERAQLVGVSDAYCRFPNYTQQQFAESLPNNARQG